MGTCYVEVLFVFHTVITMRDQIITIDVMFANILVRCVQDACIRMHADQMRL